MEFSKPITREAYGVDELSQLYGLSKGYWWSQIRKGRLKTKRFGRRVLVMKAELERYIAALDGQGGDGADASG